MIGSKRHSQYLPQSASSGSWGGFGNLADLGLGIAVMTIVRTFRKPFGANPSVFLTSGESSFGDLYIEGHRVGPAGVLDDELVLPVLRRRDLNRTLRSGRVVLSDFRAGGVVDEKVHVGILQAVRGGLELFLRRERQEVSDLSLVLYLDLLAIERRPLAQVGRLDVLRGTQGGDREYNCHHC